MFTPQYLLGPTRAQERSADSRHGSVLTKRHARRAHGPRRLLADPVSQDLEGWDRDIHGLPSAPWPSEPLAVLEPPRPTEVALEQPSVRSLIIVQSLEVGGAGEVVAWLARSLPQLGHRTRVIVAPADPELGRGSMGEQMAAAGVWVDRTDPVSLPLVLDDWRPDVVYLHGAPDWARRLVAATELPVVEALHGVEDFYGESATALLNRHAFVDRMVVVSDTVRQQFLHACPGFPARRVQTIPLAVNPPVGLAYDTTRAEAREQLGLGEEFLFVSVGRYCVQKNTYGLVAAFQGVTESVPDAHLLVAGSGEDAAYTAHVQRLAADSAHVHLRRTCPGPWRLLCAADAFVLDSFFEGSTVAPTQALSLGLPTVLTDVGGARDQLSGPVDNGRLVAAPLPENVEPRWETVRAVRYRHQGNESSLRDAMIEMAVNRDTWAARRSAIRADSLQRFAPQPTLQAHDAVLRAVARQ